MRSTLEIRDTHEIRNRVRGGRLVKKKKKLVSISPLLVRKSWLLSLGLGVGGTMYVCVMSLVYQASDAVITLSCVQCPFH